MGETDWRSVALGVVLALAAVAVPGMVDVPYFKNDFSLEFWTLLVWPGPATRATAGQADRAGLRGVLSG